jgi:protein gp37
MKDTKIEWCSSTWNPVTGCLHGCEYCYARGIAHRFAGFEPRCGGEIIPDDQKKYGKNSVWNTTDGEQLHIFDKQPQKRTKTGVWQKTVYPYGFEPTFHRYRLDEPRTWIQSRTIFVGSMADLFGDWVPDEWIESVFDACDAAPWHRYLFLTKNPKRYMKLAQSGRLPRGDNKWYGSSTPTIQDDYFYSGNHKCFLSIEPSARGRVERQS